MLDLWSRRDVDAVLDLLHEDIEWHSALTVGGLDGSVYRGHDDIRSWFRELDDAWAELKYEVEEVRDLGEGRVLMLGHFHAVGRESHLPIDQPQGFVFSREGGGGVSAEVPPTPAPDARSGSPKTQLRSWPYKTFAW